MSPDCMGVRRSGTQQSKEVIVPLLQASDDDEEPENVSRTAETLLPLVKTYILPGSTSPNPRHLAVQVADRRNGARAGRLCTYSYAGG